MAGWWLMGALGVAFALEGSVTMLAKPPRLDDDLAAAKAELEFAAECAATYMNRRVESKRHMVEDRHEYAQGRATEIWGGIKIGLGEEVYPNDPPSCAREKVQAALLRAGTRLEMAEQSIAEATEPLAHGIRTLAADAC